MLSRQNWKEMLKEVNWGMDRKRPSPKYISLAMYLSDPFPGSRFRFFLVLHYLQMLRQSKNNHNNTYILLYMQAIQEPQFTELSTQRWKLSIGFHNFVLYDTCYGRIVFKNIALHSESRLTLKLNCGSELHIMVIMTSTCHIKVGH